MELITGFEKDLARAAFEIAIRHHAFISSDDN
jgi:hypothetical protein